MFDIPMSFAALTVWILAATLVASLPMRFQYVPGVTLLVLAPAVIIWLAVDIGWLAAGFGLFAFLSMFRRPLRFFYKKAMGTA